MNTPMRKSFEADDAFPFSFVYKDTKSAQSELPDHLHDWYELVYVHRGKGTFFIDQTFYDMREGDLFAIPGNTIHRAFPDHDDPVTSTAVFFSPSLIQHASLGDPFSYLQCFEQSKQKRSYRLHPAPSLRQTLEAQFERMREELRAGGPGHRHAVTLSLHQILLPLNRGTAPADNRRPAETHIGSLWMTEILHYINDHLDGNLGLAALARRASVTPAHFSRVFKQLTGMNVTAFVMTKRIFKAKELLLDTNHTIDGIADLCGVGSVTHFHRMFKKVLGVTPAAFRKYAARSFPLKIV